MQRFHRKTSGFSLLELSIVLVIMAIVIAGGLTLGEARLQQSALEHTHEEMKAIDQAMTYFLNENARLPCPADITLQNGDPLYGREATDCADASPPAGLVRVEYPAASGKYVRIGGLPFYSLQLKEDFIDDNWYHRYLYAVSESAITALGSSDVGHIRIIDDAGAVISDDIAYVLVSHGKTGLGSYGWRSGAQIAACDAATLDGENCDNDGIFIDAVFNDGDVTANFFDDIIHWKHRMHLYQALTTGDGGGATPWRQGQAANGDTSGYALEIKGITSVSLDGNDGYAAYTAQCAADYSGSWFLRTSDLPYLEDMPVISTASRIHIDTCDHFEETDKSCYLTFSKATPALSTLNSSAADAFEDVDNLNCDNWTSNAGTDKSIALERNAGIENFRQVSATDTNGLEITSADCDATIPFICVGEK